MNYLKQIAKDAGIETEEILTINTICERLTISRSTFNNFRKKDSIPCIPKCDLKFANKQFWKIETINQFLLELQEKNQKDLLDKKEKKLIRPKIVTLCGSTKFKKEFEIVSLEEGLKGNLVFSVIGFCHYDNLNLNEEELKIAKSTHLKKILLSDEIIVIMVNNYIGDSTRNEIKYANSLNNPDLIITYRNFEK